VATSTKASNPESILLWSTATWLKWHIQEEYFGGTHYVWCSPVLNSRSTGFYSASAGRPASSDPFTIYHEIYDAIRTGDRHCAKIAEQGTNLMATATKLELDGIIDEDTRNKVLALVKFATLTDWRPLIYCIPWDPVASRVEEIDANLRAGVAKEYRIRDLTADEFQLIELMK
jgi:hypothetical protein